MPTILVTNDDGIYSPGLLPLKQKLSEIAEVIVLAPERNWSATSHSKTMHKPLRVKRVKFPVEGVTAYATSGSPSDSVAVALLGYVDEPIDLVVSGINRGPNQGQDLTYSGTVSAAFEAVIWHKPAIAFSLCDHSEDAEYEAAAAIARQIVQMKLYERLPPLTLLNVNIPPLPLEEIRGFKITRQGLRQYNDELVERVDPSGRPYYWIGGGVPTGDVTEEGTDLWATDRGYVSITPIHLDMTAYAVMQEMEAWGLGEVMPEA